MTTLTEVNPFVYTLKSDGTLLDNGALDSEPWLTRCRGEENNVRFIPTIMTSNSELLHTLLSNTKRRIALEDRIAALVKEKGFDGIDIDFEGKYAKTRDYFSTFLKGALPAHAQTLGDVHDRIPHAGSRQILGHDAARGRRLFLPMISSR